MTIAPRIFQFHVPLPERAINQPLWLSLNDRAHWTKNGVLKKYFRSSGYERALDAEIPRLDRAWMVAVLSFGDRRRRDAHNYMPTVKAIVDGAIDAGVLDDDDNTRLVGPDLRVDPGRARGVHLITYSLTDEEWVAQHDW
ncbi:hypothetical protein [Longispora urticae]